MRRLVLSLACVCALPAAARAARDGVAPERRPQTPVQRLIAELGSDDYGVRRRAEEQLIRLGPEVFDELKAAEDHDDLEIAERVRYIVQRMRVEWIHAGDAADVRRLLARYGDSSEDKRNERIRLLAALNDRAGAPALCRIARFDQSAVVARRAALALLKLELSADEREALSEACLTELGASRRAPVRWIRMEFAEPLEADAGRDWLAAIDAEARLLTAESPDTDFEIVQGLVVRHLAQGQASSSTDAMSEALVRAIDLIAEQLKRCHDAQFGDSVRNTLYALIRWDVEYNERDTRVAGLSWALRWIIKHKQWDVLASLEDKYEPSFRKNRKLLYFLAAATGKSGRDGRALELADQAFKIPTADGEERVDIAKRVAELGYIPWAEREYRHVIDERPVADEQSMEARSDLAMWLHDRNDCAGAAQVLGEFCETIETDRPARVRLLESLGKEELDSVAARRAYYQACDAEARGDFKEQRERLEIAASAYNKDPDILIAMYRSPDADEDFRQRTRALIRAAAKETQRRIDEFPEISSYYNQWAWLIGNTEGDQELAVKYSLRSLELAPDEPSFLDTLGRCYYAVGDYEKAVESQRRAVELAPHYGVMRRQLSLFERALAKSKDK